MRLRELLQADHLALKVLTGHDLLDRQVRGVSTTDLIEPGRFVKPGELVMTELTWHTGPASSQRFVAALGEVAALVSGTALKVVPDDLIDACAAAGLPLLTLPVDVPFSVVTEHVLRALLASPPKARYGSRRRLASTLVDGGSLAKLVNAVADELSVGCWVISPTGRVVVSSRRLPGEDAVRLAQAFLTARFLPGMADGLSIFPISRGAPHRIANWFIAYEGTPGEHEDLIVELAALVALERSRLEAAHRIERRVLDQLLELLESGDAALPSVVSRLHTLHVETEHGLLAVVASAGPSAEVGVTVLDELLRPLAPGVVTASDGVAVALVPLAGNSAEDLTAHLLRGARTLEAGLERITLGLSGVTTSPAALSGLLEEARNAHALAALGGSPVSLVTGDDAGSHRTLLAAIPGPLRRSFRDRLLGPLEDYDAAHQTDLLATLEAFLEESGNWAATAAGLHVHVNTLRYRLRRIEELTGRSLSSWDGRVDFILALRMK
ncbi:PucR family transcriptional regulator [Nonomuraea soli]|uniref:Sugar diacid utilization regulator n=1 Tax=Nonomuraea soli TaxID=1032476 RepID=A0A7W0HMK3_9ACTN|nr:PucR family transcriptional regulator [Nonomuraea soli]MBA2888864.1 sugar diacid utilization regulator [Nonomuraea soli]